MKQLSNTEIIEHLKVGRIVLDHFTKEVVLETEETKVRLTKKRLKELLKDGIIKEYTYAVPYYDKFYELNESYGK